MTETTAQPKGEALLTVAHLRELEAEGFWDWMVAARRPAECWEWRRGKTKPGYGYLTVFTPGAPVRSIRMYAHRAAWGIHNGQVAAKGVEIDHLCHNPACCNPLHLEAVDRLLNMRRTRLENKPIPYTSKRGKTTWRITFYDYSTGTRRRTSKTFDTEEAAVEAARKIREDRKRLNVKGEAL